MGPPEVLGAALSPAHPATARGVRRLPATARVRNGRRGADGALLEAGQPGKDLHRRGRRISPADSAVRKRLVRLLGVQVLELRHLLGPGDPADEYLRVEVRSTRHRQDLAVVGVEGDGRPARPSGPLSLSPVDRPFELLLHRFLQVQVYGEPEVLTRNGVGDALRFIHLGDTLGPPVIAPPVGCADGYLPPQNVHGILFLTWLATQDLLVGKLDPAFANHRVVIEPLEGLPLELPLSDRAGVAQDVGSQLPVRVVAYVVVVDNEAVVPLGPLADVHNALAIGVLLDEHRTVLVARGESRVVTRENLLLVGVEDVGEF